MVIYKLKPGKEKKFLEWGHQLMRLHLKDAVETLKEENCSREMVYVFKIGNSFYLVGHMEGDNILPSTENPLNKAHRAVIEDCIESKIELFKAYDIKP